MHTAAKVILILGTAFTILGIGGFVLGIGGAEDIAESLDSYVIEDKTSGTIEIDDSDDLGEIGLTFWVKGVYEDLNENGEWDVCENTNVEVTEKPRINRDWDNATVANGGFYYEIDYEGNNQTSNCNAIMNNTDNSSSGGGLVKIGRACYACYSGNFSFESNQSVWVTYDDKILEDVGEDIGIAIVGFIGGFGGVCCGILFLIIGGIMALTMNDNKQQVMYAPPANNMMIANQGMVQPSTYTNPDHMAAPMTTHMSAPSFDEPNKGGL